MQLTINKLFLAVLAFLAIASVTANDNRLDYIITKSKKNPYKNKPSKFCQSWSAGCTKLSLQKNGTSPGTICEHVKNNKQTEVALECSWIPAGQTEPAYFTEKEAKYYIEAGYLRKV